MCPWCKQRLRMGDDVTVPQGGVFYHRACWIAKSGVHHSKACKPDDIARARVGQRA